MDSNKDSSDAPDRIYEGDVSGGGKGKLDPRHDEYLTRYQTASSVVIPREVFESMYLSPYTQRLGHLRSTFGNPTPMYAIGFIQQFVRTN